MQITNTVQWEVRTFLKKRHTGVLSTISTSVNSFPYGSVCPFMLDYEGCPIFYVSNIAHHTKNIKVNNKVCLTVMDELPYERLTGGRVSFMGTALEINTEMEKIINQRYIRFFPMAEKYKATHDFKFYKIEPLQIRYIAGFGSIHWVKTKLKLASIPELIALESRICDHMNHDHQDILNKLIRKACHIDIDSARMTGLDSEGFYIHSEQNMCYIPFPTLCTSVDSVHRSIIEITQKLD